MHGRRWDVWVGGWGGQAAEARRGHEEVWQLRLDGCMGQADASECCLLLLARTAPSIHLALTAALATDTTASRAAASSSRAWRAIVPLPARSWHDGRAGVGLQGALSSHVPH